MVVSSTTKLVFMVCAVGLCLTAIYIQFRFRTHLVEQSSTLSSPFYRAFPYYPYPHVRPQDEMWSCGNQFGQPMSPTLRTPFHATILFSVVHGLTPPIQAESVLDQADGALRRCPNSALSIYLHSPHNYWSVRRQFGGMTAWQRAVLNPYYVRGTTLQHHIFNVLYAQQCIRSYDYVVFLWAPSTLIVRRGLEQYLRGAVALNYTHKSSFVYEAVDETDTFQLITGRNKTQQHVTDEMVPRSLFDGYFEGDDTAYIPNVPMQLEGFFASNAMFEHMLMTLTRRLRRWWDVTTDANHEQIFHNYYIPFLVIYPALLTGPFSSSGRRVLPSFLRFLTMDSTSERIQAALHGGDDSIFGVFEVPGHMDDILRVKVRLEQVDYEMRQVQDLSNAPMDRVVQDVLRMFHPDDIRENTVCAAYRSGVNMSVPSEYDPTDDINDDNKDKRHHVVVVSLTSGYTEDPCPECILDNIDNIQKYCRGCAVVLNVFDVNARRLIREKKSKELGHSVFLNPRRFVNVRDNSGVFTPHYHNVMYVSKHITWEYVVFMALNEMLFREGLDTHLKANCDGVDYEHVDFSVQQPLRHSRTQNEIVTFTELHRASYSAILDIPLILSKHRNPHDQLLSLLCDEVLQHAMARVGATRVPTNHVDFEGSFFTRRGWDVVHRALGEFNTQAYVRHYWPEHVYPAALLHDDQQRVKPPLRLCGYFTQWLSAKSNTHAALLQPLMKLPTSRLPEGYKGKFSIKRVDRVMNDELRTLLRNVSFV
eukprot:PhF_6_TR31800/c1_g2_i4/m.46888